MPHTPDTNLVLSRKAGETLALTLTADQLRELAAEGGLRIEVTVIRGSRCRLGVKAPRCVRVLRTEVERMINAQ